MTLQKTKSEILWETLLYYARDPLDRRSSDTENMCSYLGPNGQKCAFSRCCSLEGLDKIKLINGPVIQLSEEGIDYNAVLAPEYRGHELQFWTEVQDFHDLDEYWDDCGVASAGLVEFRNLLSKWS